jgi:glucose/arabinose dehydrogenase
MPMTSCALPLALAALLLTGCGSDGEAAPAATSTAPAPAGAPVPTTAATTATPATTATTPAPTTPAPGPTTLTTGLEAPWGLAFLPSGEALVSERDTGKVLKVPAGGGPATEVMTLPGVVPNGEGGLLGLAVSPEYPTDGLVFAYVTTADDNRIVRFRLGGTHEAIVTGIPTARNHNGGRLAFGPDGSLYAGTGDATDTDRSQDPSSLGGKVLRMTPEGEPVAGASSLVFSSGHRNVQGLAFDAAGRLYATEFGQNRTDEVNQVQAGDNGGWPAVEGAGTGGGRFAAPIVTWDTSEASPSGAAVSGSALYVAALRGERLWKVPLDGRGGAGEPTVALDGLGRIRTVEVAPDGSVWLMTSNTDGRGDPSDGDDRIVRVTPP